MNHYVGIDVSKEKRDVHCHGVDFQVSNNTAGFKKLTNKLAKGTIQLIVCEATGGYEKSMVNYVQKKQFPVYVAHANKIRNFAKSKGLKAKTDKIDARVIVDYAQAMQLTCTSLILSESAEKMKELVKRKGQLQRDKQAEQNRLDKISPPRILSSIKKHIRWLDKAIKEIETPLLELSASKEISKTVELITSVPGVGMNTAQYIIAYLPELGTCSHKEIAALVGVAPYNHDSGNFKGKFTKGAVNHCVERFIWLL